MLVKRVLQFTHLPTTVHRTLLQNTVNSLAARSKVIGHRHKMGPSAADNSKFCIGHVSQAIRHWCRSLLPTLLVKTYKGIWFFGNSGVFLWCHQLANLVGFHSHLTWINKCMLKTGWCWFVRLNDHSYWWVASASCWIRLAILSLPSASRAICSELH